jgi:hypothetical protein
MRKIDNKRTITRNTGALSMKLVTIGLLLLIGLSPGMELSVSGNATGNGTNEIIIEIGSGNWTGNGSAWVITWSTDLDGSNQRTPL